MRRRLTSISYLSEGNDRKIRENEAAAEDIKTQITSTNDARATIDSTISAIQDELGKSESYRTNINFNILDREEVQQIKELNEKIQETDLDSMSKARKDFNVKYRDKMEEEKNVADAVSSPVDLFARRRDNQLTVGCSGPVLEESWCKCRRIAKGCNKR